MTDAISNRELDGIMGWTVDGRGQSAKAIRREIRSVRLADPLRRPIIAFVEQSPESLSNLADVVIVRNGIELDSNTKSQRWLALGSPLVSSSRWLPLRNAAWNGVIAGHRGFVLITAQMIDEPNERHMRNLAELLNIELGTLRPWILSPQLERFESRDDRSKYDFVALSGHHSSIAFVQPRETSRRFSYQHDIEIPTGDHRLVFRVEPGGLSPPVSERRVAGGIRISLDPSKPDGLLLLTDRKRIVENMARHLRSISSRSNQLLVEVLRQELLLLDRRIEHAVSDPTRRSHLRQEVHALHGRIAPLLESHSENTADFRQLDHVLGQLERVHVTIDH